MTIPEDVARFVIRRFAPSDRADALEWLGAATIHDGTAASPRLLRCAAVASGGSLERLRAEIEMLKIDWRDVIVAGEYVPGSDDLVRVRNLNDPIPDDL
jgi:hypothetical protein